MFPAKPAFSPVVAVEARQRMFGTLEYVKNPIPGNPENIKLVGDWKQRNIVLVHLPQLAGVPGFPSDCMVHFHRKGEAQLKAMVEEWATKGLIEKILSWDGAFVPRLIRGGNSLSNHAFGTAFDINAVWNPLGQKPAIGKGCVYDLVPIANRHGFYWGGHYQKRQDGMHFELAKIITA